MAIVPLTTAYLDAFVEFRQQSARETGEISRMGHRRARRHIEHIQAVPHLEAYVVAHGDQVIGQLFLNYRQRYELLRVQLISVLARYQRRGIGRSLLEHAFQRGQQAGVAALDVITHRDNEEALSLYRRQGFQPERSYQDGRVRLLRWRHHPPEERTPGRRGERWRRFP
mgnify:CR=1 FL=1